MEFLNDPAILILATAAINWVVTQSVNKTDIGWLKEAVKRIDRDISEIKNHR